MPYDEKPEAPAPSPPPPVVTSSPLPKPIATASPSLSLIDGRYQDHGDGTVTDVKTGLMWMRCSVGEEWTGSGCRGGAETFKYDQAAKLTVSYAGSSNWRMPKMEELQTLIYCSNGTTPEEAWSYSCNGKDNRNGESYQRPTINLQVFPDTSVGSGGISRWYWVSVPPFTGTRVLDFGSGLDFNMNRNNSYRVRLVRTGQ